MRFIGSKVLLLKDIEKILPKNSNNKVFCDLFSGTACVARHFKSKYEIISNDLLYFSYVLQNAYLKHNCQLHFPNLGFNPFEFFNNHIPHTNKIEKAFIFENYSPNKRSNRMFFTNINALKIDHTR